MWRWSAGSSKALNCSPHYRAAAWRWGFYSKTQSPLPIKSIRVAADVPAAERSNLEVIRTDTATFRALIESRRNRPEEFFKLAAGRIDLCNVPIAVREAPHAH